MTSNPAFTEGNIQKANSLACLASVFNRVIARKLEREQEKKMVEGGGGREKRKQRFLLPPPPASFLFFLLSSQRSRRTRAETLATQAKLKFNGRSLHSMQNIQKSHLHDTVS